MTQKRITDDLHALMAVLPPRIVKALEAANNSDKLLEIVLDLGRLPMARFVDRELALFKVKADPQVRAEIMQIVDIFRAHIVDIGRRSLIIEATGDEGKINAIEDSLRAFGIMEMVRTGKVAMVRGPKG